MVEKEDAYMQIAILKMLATILTTVITGVANVGCFVAGYQPELPDGAKKFSKFH